MPYYFCVLFFQYKFPIVLHRHFENTEIKKLLVIFQHLNIFSVIKFKDVEWSDRAFVEDSKVVAVQKYL